MTLSSGARAIPIRLPAIDGTTFSGDTLAGRRYLLSFFRFASCPFCNLRLHQLVSRFEELGPGFTIVAIFDSPIENLRRHAARHDAPFPILADEANTFYRAYGIRHSTAGMLRGMVTRMPTLLTAMFRNGFIPTSFRGSLTTMPADFLINENGIVDTAYYGQDEGDHLPFDAVRHFALKVRTHGSGRHESVAPNRSFTTSWRSRNGME